MNQFIETCWACRGSGKEIKLDRYGQEHIQGYCPFCGSKGWVRVKPAGIKSEPEDVDMELGMLQEEIEQLIEKHGPYTKVCFKVCTQEGDEVGYFPYKYSDRPVGTKSDDMGTIVRFGYWIKRNDQHD